MKTENKAKTKNTPSVQEINVGEETNSPVIA
jgi:hypothetical protein